MLDPISVTVAGMVWNIVANRVDRHILDRILDPRANHDIQGRLRDAWAGAIADALHLFSHAERYALAYANLTGQERRDLPGQTTALAAPAVLDRVFPPATDGGAGPTSPDVGGLLAADEEEARRLLRAALEREVAWVALPAAFRGALDRHLLDGLVFRFVEGAVKRDSKARDALFFQQLIAVRRDQGASDADIAALRAEVRAALADLPAYRRWASDVLPLLEALAATTGRIEAATGRIEGRLTEAERQGEDERERRLRAAFALLKPVADLRPADLRYTVVQPGETLDAGRRRPFYDGVYVPRTFAPYDGGSLPAPNPPVDEAALADELRRGRGFVLLGLPLEGKTRALYDVVSKLPDYWIVKPRADRPVPDDDAFALLADRAVILLLDDMQTFARPTLDLDAFCEALDARAATWVIAATCRSGALGPERSELGAVLAARATGVRAVYEAIPWKLTLAPLTPNEKDALATGIGREDWDKGDDWLAPTPGHITMGDAIAYMRLRFNELSGAQRDILRALKLLVDAGVPATTARLDAVLRDIHVREVPDLGDELDLLRAQGFLLRWSDADVAPEMAYLEYTVAEVEAPARGTDRDRLQTVLDGLADADGLALLGVTHYDAADWTSALACFDRALALRPDDAATHNNRGVTLRYLGRWDDALAALDRALALRSDDAATHNNRGAALVDLGRYAEALVAFDRALALRPDNVTAHHGQGVALARLGRDEEALAAFDRALALHPDDSTAHHYRGLVLGNLDQWDDALACFDRALALRPDDADTHHNRGLALACLRRWDDALAALDRALALRPDDSTAHNNRGIVLGCLRRNGEALVAFDRALALRPDDPNSHYGRGLALMMLGRDEEAQAAFAREAELRANADS